ncbi:YHYH protein [Flavivirga jejuensis]|uniref:YHYH protein n=1 Tax=Flavivirga jejuensis TaxID=870487 RepID=A0ABT8WUW2_9FLAO|nr:YHYH protein [Flavivirga jejuensis]MDO5976874.1 YHYH protein [Flavivirga jejuensis]
MKKKLVSPLLFLSLFLSLTVLQSCGSDDSEVEEEEDTECVQQEVINGSGDCSVELDIEQEVSITIDGDYRIVVTNNIPNHLVGVFQNADVSAQSETYSITTSPEDTGELVWLQGDSGPEYMFGILLNGVELDPIAAEPWPHSDLGIMDPDVNWDWNLEALTAPIGLDCNYAHVQPTGKYHYHGAPTIQDLFANADGTEMVLVGWAADGFPIYYKYAYTNATDNSSEIIAMTSSYQIIDGYRPGDGITAPCSEYNGAYSADYEYIAGLGTLDETNGRTGVTPEFPDGTYYYVLTDGDEFPSIPRYFRGTPSDDFKQGR